MLWTEKRVFSKLEAWLDLIRSARFDDSGTAELIEGKPVSWSRGQFPVSLRYLGERWQWGKTKVDNFLSLLEREKMIVSWNVHGQRILELVNYEVYNSVQYKRQVDGPLQKDTSEVEDGKEDRDETAARHGQDKYNKVNKENKVKNNVYGAVAPTHSPEDLEKFKAFQNWILENAPKVARMKRPFTIKEYIRLMKKLPKKQVVALLLAMENRSTLLKKNDSAYLTILNWAERDFNHPKTTNYATTTEQYLKERERLAEQARKRATE
jgi:hypothetical protein